MCWQIQHTVESSFTIFNGFIDDWIAQYWINVSFGCYRITRSWDFIMAEPKKIQLLGYFVSTKSLFRFNTVAQLIIQPMPMYSSAVNMLTTLVFYHSCFIHQQWIHVISISWRHKTQIGIHVVRISGSIFPGKHYHIKLDYTQLCALYSIEYDKTSFWVSRVTENSKWYSVY